MAKKGKINYKYPIVFGLIGAVIYYIVTIANKKPYDTPDHIIAAGLGAATFGFLLGFVIGYVVAVVARSKK